MKVERLSQSNINFMNACMAINRNSITFCTAWYLFRSDTDSMLIL